MRYVPPVLDARLGGSKTGDGDREIPVTGKNLESSGKPWFKGVIP